MCCYHFLLWDDTQSHSDKHHIDDKTESFSLHQMLKKLKLFPKGTFEKDVPRKRFPLSTACRHVSARVVESGETMGGMPFKWQRSILPRHPCHTLIQTLTYSYQQDFGGSHCDHADSDQSKQSQIHRSSLCRHTLDWQFPLLAEEQTCFHVFHLPLEDTATPLIG